MRRDSIGCALVILLLSMTAWGYGGDDLEEAAKQEENPLSGVVNLQVRNSTNYLIGPFDRSQNILQLRPTLPLRLGPWVTMNTGFIIPLVWQPDSTTPHDSASGLGDITLNVPFSMTFREIFFFGLGPTFRFPTATDTRLGGSDSGMFSIGPTGSVQITPGHWVFGLSFDNTWSVAGRGSGSTVNVFTLTPAITFNLPLGYFIVMQSPMAADWTAPNASRWVVPWGGGIGGAKLFREKVGITYEVQAYWNAVRPDGAALWQLRFQLSLFFPRLTPRG